MVGADAVCHGATGKGNDQVRFELGYYALDPDIKVIAPWREWDLNSRTKLIEYAEKHNIEIATDKRGEAPFSVDANLLHTSSEGKALEDPYKEAPEFVYQRTVSPEEAPDKATYIEVGFEQGDAVSIDDKKMSPATLLTKLNELKSPWIKALCISKTNSCLNMPNWFIMDIGTRPSAKCCKPPSINLKN